jgi:hypothetical protein
MMCDTSGRWYVLLVVKGGVVLPRKDGRLVGGLPDPVGGPLLKPDGSQASSGTGSTTCHPSAPRADAVTSKHDR